MANIVPRSFWDAPSLLPSLLSDSWIPQNTGVNITDDEKHVFVEAAVPGVKAEDLDLTYHRGMLHIRTKSEDKSEDGSQRSFRALSYSVDIPTEAVEEGEPEARCENGMLRVVFNKAPSAQPKKIAVKKG
jgi:HSP20 family protein